MNPISSKDGNIPAATAVNPVNPNKPIGAEEEKSFSNALKDKNTKEKLPNENKATITPQEVRKQITDSIVKQGVLKSIEKTKEMMKEQKE